MPTLTVTFYVATHRDSQWDSCQTAYDIGKISVEPRPLFPLDHTALLCINCGEIWARLVSDDPAARWRAAHTLCKGCDGSAAILPHVRFNRIQHVDPGVVRHELRAFNPNHSGGLAAAG